jgi:hypothetical protein
MPAHFIDPTPDVIGSRAAKDAYKPCKPSLLRCMHLTNANLFHARIGRISIGAQAVCLSADRKS